MSNKQINTVTAMTDRVADLRKRAAQSSELQQLDDEEIFIGLLVEGQSAANLHGENYQIFTSDESGNPTIVSPAGWLKKNLKAQGAEVGDLIAIICLGKKQSPIAGNHNVYSLIVDRDRKGKQGRIIYSSYVRPSNH